MLAVLCAWVIALFCEAQGSGLPGGEGEPPFFLLLFLFLLWLRQASPPPAAAAPAAAAREPLSGTAPQSPGLAQSPARNVPSLMIPRQIPRNRNNRIRSHHFIAASWQGVR